MTHISAFTLRLAGAARRFAAGSSASVGIIFAVAAPLLIAAVGVAVDLSRANSARTDMQTTLDSAAMMLSKTAPALTATQISTAGAAYFNGMFNRPDVSNLNVTSTYSSTSGSQIVMNVTGTIATTFTSIIGYSSLNLSVTSTAKWGTARLRVALALDVTGSMADDDKLPALKTAAKNLLTQLKTAATNNGDVYVSIIPFAKDVNIGASNYTQGYIDWTEWTVAPANNCSKSGATDFLSCLLKGGIWGLKSRSTWNGCIMDRGGTVLPDSANFDQLVSAPGSTNASKYPAEQYDACPVAMMGLSYDWTALSSLIDSMTAQGATNQPIGLVWGWQSLAGGGPLTVPPKDPNYTYTDVIILMSDGLNTKDRWYGNGVTASIDVDGRMTGTCTNVKNANVVLYTIQVNTGGDPTSNLLKSCASPDKFVELKSASQLITTFAAIGTALTKLRIAN